ncbi:MAG: decarboxylating 6-phosphogluconate dehydrogenase [Gammaproteobacteria bacterium]|nr:decarboxylating 6-phosphogluconate dehydrogenase [Gammaproteobacteria bacterium]
MRMAMVVLGKMGANMVRRLRRGGIEIVGYDRSREVVDALAREEGMVAAEGLADLVSKLPAPRVVWVMLPAGDITETCLAELHNLLSKGDLVIDGGNTNYHDSQRRGAWLAEAGIEFVDAGTSGGVWGLENGYCLMVGGSDAAIELLSPALKVLAPGHDYGWAHVGPVGAGHFTKMVHNGVEYALMTAYSEGYELLAAEDLVKDPQHGSVVRSWLLDLTADALKADQTLENIKPIVPDSGEGRWTAIEAIDQGQALPVISMSLAMRFASQDQAGYAHRLLSMMRNAFGGHAVAKK